MSMPEKKHVLLVEEPLRYRLDFVEEQP